MFWQLSWSHAGGRQRAVDGNEICAKLIERKGKLALLLKQKSLSPDKGTSLLSLLIRFLLHWKGSCLQQEEPRAMLTLAACFIFRIFHSGKGDKGRCTPGLGPHVVFSSSLHRKVQIFFRSDLDRRCSLILGGHWIWWACELSYLSPVWSLCHLPILLTHAIIFSLLKQCLVNTHTHKFK